MPSVLKPEDEWLDCPWSGKVPHNYRVRRGTDEFGRRWVELGDVTWDCWVGMEGDDLDGSQRWQLLVFLGEEILKKEFPEDWNNILTWNRDNFNRQRKIKYKPMTQFQHRALARYDYLTRWMISFGPEVYEAPPEKGLKEMTTLKEHHLRQWFKGAWGGYCDTVEAARGGTVGFPDILIMAAGTLVPIELKAGTVTYEGLLRAEVRPAQLRWHSRFLVAGGSAWFLIGVGDTESFAVHLTQGSKINKLIAEGLNMETETVLVGVNFEYKRLVKPDDGVRKIIMELCR